MGRTCAAVAGIALLGCALTAAPAHAQAWLPPQGEGTVSILFTNVLSKDHFLPDERYDFGHIDSNTLFFDVTYGVTDRLAVTFGLPVVASRYRGSFPHRPVTLDDGNWHVTMQDVRFGVRYNVVRRPLLVTPYLGVDMPSREYEFYAHSAPGRQLKEVAGGVTVGKLFPSLGLVLQGRYGFTVSERALDIPRRFSVASIEAGYFLTPSLRVLAMTATRIGHTGIDLYPNSGNGIVLPAEVFRHHDQISRESYWNVGGGAAYSLTDTWDLFGSFTTTLRGRNTHAVNRGISLGVSMTFSVRGADPFASRDAREESLVRCLCQKGD